MLPYGERQSARMSKITGAFRLNPVCTGCFIVVSIIGVNLSKKSEGPISPPSTSLPSLFPFPFLSLSLPSPPLPLPPLPFPLPLPFPSLPLEVGPLNAARESGGAL